ncbi:MAG: NmrA family protein [Bacillales bacterium]|jgi:uncharacterized protein YbjT (DUF2867 family)|nr:NmrA family protein [Bacillales bacterium]
MNKILVTGATGNVGQYVVKYLLELGESVVCTSSQINPETIKNAENRHFDFTKPETFQTALEGVDRVFLMRPPHLGKPEDLYPFIDCMKENEIQLVSFLSLMGVENNTIPPHHKIEKYIERSGIPYAHVRPSFFMQNVSGIHAVEICEEDKIFIPAGKSLSSFIDAEDIGEATATLLHYPETYANTAHTITGPESLNYEQVADILTKVLGRKITYAKPSLLRYRSVYIKKRKLPKGFVNVTVGLYLMTRLGAAKQVTDTFFQITGKHPRTFKEFAEKNKVAFQK